MNTRSHLLLFLCVLGAPAVNVASAGDLAPPIGLVAPTPGPEPRIVVNSINTPGDANSLFKITQPGSYYLPGNITGLVGKHGVEIAASGVTLDLMGFDLAGVPAMGNFDGVNFSAPGTFTNITITNGSVRSWGGDGIDLASALTVNCRVEGVLASGNAGAGIITNAGGTITNCSASGNRDGILSNNGNCTISNCSASGNTLFGIGGEPGSTITNCSVNENGGTGIVAGSRCTVSNCTSRANLDLGILVGNDCSIVGCTVTGNTSSGIQTNLRCAILKTTINGTTAGPGVKAASAGLRIEGSTINANSTFGVSMNTASNISELAVVNCTITGNGSAGVSSEASTQVLDSFISSNGGAGVSVTSSSLIRGCTINTNAGSGIDLLTNANVVMNNTLSSNNAAAIATTAGILVGGADNTIDGNRLFANPQGGIKLNGSGNLVLRNYLANSGATITPAGAGNAVAQILAPGAGFISTDPNANFIY